MNALLLAQLGGYGILSWLLIAVVVAGAVAILVVILKQFGVAIPPYIVKILWIILAVAVGVIALKFIFSLL